MVCSTCGQSKAWHEENQPHHQYTEVGGGIQTKPTQIDPAAPHQGDVIVRMALLKAGLITEADLKRAQLWVDKGVQRGHALVVEPDPDAPGENRFRLLTFEELIESVAGDAG